MLDPADPSGSARLQVAAAHPHTYAPAAFACGGTQDLGRIISHFFITSTFLSLSFQVYSGEM
jgi:hypothetical protein